MKILRFRICKVQGRLSAFWARLRGCQLLIFWVFESLYFVILLFISSECLYSQEKLVSSTYTVCVIFWLGCVYWHFPFKDEVNCYSFSVPNILWDFVCNKMKIIQPEKMEQSLRKWKSWIEKKFKRQLEIEWKKASNVDWRSWPNLGFRIFSIILWKWQYPR